MLATFVVDVEVDEPDIDIDDGECNSSTDPLEERCSLRAAIDNANRIPGPHLIRFDTREASPRVMTVVVDNLLPAISEQVTIDGGTPFGRTTITGPPDSLAPGNGLQIIAANSTVRSLIIQRFSGAGVALQISGGHTVEDAFLLNNQQGLLLQNVASATVRDNLITDNRSSGVRIEGGGNVTLTGNTIGAGDEPLADMGNRGYGVHLMQSADNVIGGNIDDATNVISGNTLGGVRIEGPASTNNRIERNLIGVNNSGQESIFNGGPGVSIDGATRNFVGGQAEGVGNVISGNLGAGVVLLGGGEHVVARNHIGVAADGLKKLENLDDGISVLGSSQNLIGGVAGISGNIIAGNVGRGVAIEGETANGNVVAGNLIGAVNGGMTALGNSSDGVFVAAPNNTIGGLNPNSKNLISGNGGAGVLIASMIATENLVQRNAIGASADGQFALPNDNGGVVISQAPDNLIGGAVQDAGNLISGNINGGVVIQGAFAVGNRVEGNAIGVKLDRESPLPNTIGGILISDANNNAIGGEHDGAANIIAHSGGPGVVINNGAGNTMLRNSIFDNSGPGIHLVDSPQVKPVLTGVTIHQVQRFVEGVIQGPANTTFHIEFFSDERQAAPNAPQGRTFLDSIQVTTDAEGAAPIRLETINLDVGRLPITATATSPGDNTSEFSVAVLPELVHVLTHGFNPTFWDFEGFRSSYRNEYPPILAQGAIGTAYENLVGTYVSAWDSSSGWVQALPHAVSAAFQLAQGDTIRGPLSLFRVFLDMQKARRLAEQAAQQIVGDLTSSILEAPTLGQKIHLIGHSRGAAVNARVSQLLSNAGYTVDQYTSLDGFSTDWRFPSNLLGDISIVDEAAALRKLNYRVQQSLAAVVVENTVSALENAIEAILDGLFGAPRDVSFGVDWFSVIDEWRAPERDADGFKDLLILGHGANNPSNHLNITPLYFTSPLQYFRNGPLSLPPPPALHEEPPAGEPPDAATLQTIVTAPFHNLFDGSIELVGDYWRQVLATDFSSLTDPFLIAWAELANDQQILLQSVWDAEGQVELVVDGNNTALRMTQSSDASIGQYVVLDSRAHSLQFDLHVESAGQDDLLQVYFGDTILDAIDLASAPPDSQVTLSLTPFAGQADDLQFVLTGPGETPASIQLDNIDVVTELEIRSLTALPQPVEAPQPATVTAADISDPNAVVDSVSFYRESNGQPGLQMGVAGDELLGIDASAGDGYTAELATAGLSGGAHTVYALAQNDQGAAGPLAMVEVEIVIPNAQPTLDAIDDLTINEDEAQTIPLAGITAGGTDSQPLRVTARSSNPALIPDPLVLYVSPSDMGSIQFTPSANQSGSADLTVTVTDAGADGDFDTANDNLEFTWTFSVVVLAINDWHNLRNALDVNDDTFVAPDDALAVINTLIIEGGRELPEIVGPLEFYYDTTDDNFVAPDDALRVINHLIDPPAPPPAAGEGELTATSAALFDFALADLLHQGRDPRFTIPAAPIDLSDRRRAAAVVDAALLNRLNSRERVQSQTANAPPALTLTSAPAHRPASPVQRPASAALPAHAPDPWSKTTDDWWNEPLDLVDWPPKGSDLRTAATGLSSFFA